MVKVRERVLHSGVANAGGHPVSSRGAAPDVSGEFSPDPLVFGPYWLLNIITITPSCIVVSDRDPEFLLYLFKSRGGSIVSLSLFHFLSLSHRNYAHQALSPSLFPHIWLSLFIFQHSRDGCPIVFLINIFDFKPLAETSEGLWIAIQNFPGDRI